MTDHTVSTSQVAVIGASNSLATGADVSTNGGTQLDTNGIDSFDSGGQKTVDIDAADGSAIFGVVADEKFLKFNGATGEMEMGLKSKIRGVSSYSNDSVYVHETFESISAWGKTFGGSGTIAVGGGYALLTATNAANDYAHMSLNRVHQITAWSWTKVRRFKTKVKISGFSNGGNAHFGLGLAAGLNNTIARKIMFMVDDAGDVYAWTANGATTTQTSLSTNISDGSEHLYEFIYDPDAGPSAVELYIDGTYKITVVATTPESDADLTSSAVYFSVHQGVSPDAELTMEVSEYKFEQAD